MARANAAAAVITGANLTLLLCFSLNMVGRGLSDSFAVFLVPLGDQFRWSRKDLTGVFATSLLVYSAAAPFAGLLLARFGYRTLYLAGLVCLAVGLMLASTIETLLEVYLYIGLTSGIALATLGMVPASTLLKDWYSARLPTAIGIAYTGLGFGTLLVLPAAQYLIEVAGWRFAYRTLGEAVAVITVVVAFLPWRRIAAGSPHIARPREAAPSMKVVVQDVSRAVRRPIFWGLASVFMFTSAAMYIVMVQSVAYLVSTGVTPLRAASVMGILGVLSLGGMVTSGYFAGRVGFAVTGVVSYSISLAGLGLLVWLAHSPPAFALAGFVLLFGFSQGTRGPLVATLATREFPGRMAGPVFGCVASAGGIGGALGSWSAGWLYDHTGHYEASFALAATTLVLGAIVFSVFPEFRRGHARPAHADR